MVSDIKAVIQNLSPAQADILLLLYNGASVDDMVKETGYHRSNVLRRIAKLQKQLKGAI